MDQEIIIRILLAALWGGIVGIEREYRSKSAGFRTMIMISVGACLFTIMSNIIGGSGNPDRIAANVVTGIGFLGAGVIFRGAENRVTGITTAATIWTVSAVGMAIGAGYYLAAGAASILIIIVLALLPYIEIRIDLLSQTRTYTIRRKYLPNAAHRYESIMKEHCLKYRKTALVKEGETIAMSWEATGNAKHHHAFTAAILEDKEVDRFEY